MAENTLSQNIGQAISDFADIKQAIEDKGVTVPSGTPTSDYADLIDDIPSGDDSVLISLIERTATSIDIPEGTTKIGERAFKDFTALTGVTIPTTVLSIQQQAFDSTHLTSVVIPGSVAMIKWGGFYNCFYLTEVEIKNGVQTIADNVFYGDNKIETLKLPNSLTSVSHAAFTGCSKLTNVTIENGFNCDNLHLEASTYYTAATIVSWLNALADRTGLSAYTLTIGADNIAKLTAEEIAIATNKNWNLA